MPSGGLQENLFSDYAKRVVRTKADKTTPAPNRNARVRLIVCASMVWSVLILGRLYQLQIAQHQTWSGTATKQHASVQTLASERGPIFDRNGRLLATSVPGGSIFARPRQIEDKEEVATRLAHLLELPEERVLKKLHSKSPFVWIKRQAPRPLAIAIEQEEIRGVGYLLESRRYYPYGSAAATLLGKVGMDGQGLSGLEARFEKHLASPAKDSHVARDGVGKILHVSQDLTGLPKGKPLSLTLDASLQLIMDEELEAGRRKAKAERAFAVMMDSVSGEILGLSQSPSPNFNYATIKSRELLKNHVFQLSFEPGSIMKPFVAALALEEGVTHFHELINCENGSYRYGGHTINDVHPSSLLSTYNVVVHSSNVGMTKLGDRLGKEKIYNGLRKFGFGSKTGVQFPGEAAGLFRNPKGWYPIDIATHSFGQGIAVTPLQVVRAVSSLVNGGILPNASLVYGGGERKQERILSEETAEMAKRMMIGVVQDDGGTGKRARIPGVLVGGKTGTAQRAKDDGRGYEKGSYIASFVGFADGAELGIKSPITLLVVMDRPRAATIDGGRAIYGGVASAPVFKRIMHRSLRFLSTQNEGYTFERREGDNQGEFNLNSPGVPTQPFPQDGFPNQKGTQGGQKGHSGFRLVSF